MATHKAKNGNKFTVQELDNLPAEWAGHYLSDGEGLRGKVRVSKAKVKQNGKPEISVSWEYSMRVEGKQIWFACGTYPKASMAQIREKRDQARGYVKQGLDPREVFKAEALKEAEAQRAVIAREEKRKAEGLTVSDLITSWTTAYQQGVKSVNRKDGNKDIIATLNKHILPAIGSKEVRAVESEDLIQIYKGLSDRRQYKTIIELHKTLAQMFRWALDEPKYQDLIIGTGPTTRIMVQSTNSNAGGLVPYGYESKRDRILSEAEITLLYERFKDQPVKEEVQLAVWICLSCTCRAGELAMAEWSHVDFEAGTWFIPAENTKGQERLKTDHTVFLSDFALRQFTRLKELSGRERWCFPAPRSGGHVDIKTFAKAIGDRQIKFMQRDSQSARRTLNDSLVVGDEQWTMHDLRRTSATMIQMLYPSAEGIFIASRCLHHSMREASQSDKPYLHYDYEPQMREAWRLLGERIDLLTFNQSANVVTFNQNLKA